MGSGTSQPQRPGIKQKSFMSSNSRENLVSINGDNLDAELEFNYDYTKQIEQTVNHCINYGEVELQATIELYVSCENLVNMDIMSDSDPQVKLQKFTEGEWYDVGVTEIISDNLDPKFATPFIFSYNIDNPPKLKFDVYDVDKCNSINNALEIDEMGDCECELEDILKANEHYLKLPLDIFVKNQKKKDDKQNFSLKKNKVPSHNRFLKVKGYPCDMHNNQFSFKMKMDGFKSKQEIFVKVSKQVNKEYWPLYMTECVKNNQKGVLLFNNFMIEDSKLFDSDTLQFQIYEFNKNNTKLKLLGEEDINLEKLKLAFRKQRTYKMEFHKGKSIIGSLEIIELKEYIYNYEFLQYIYGGCNFKIILALDFSNPNNYDEDIPEEQQYLFQESQQIINVAVETLQILQHLNVSNKIVTYGFGAKMPPYRTYLSNCFALNADFFDPEIDSVNTIKEKFTQNIQSMKFSNRAVYSEVIAQARKFAQNDNFNNQEQNYVMLVVVSKGNLFSTDLQKVIDETVLSSYHPMTILNVGITGGHYEYIPLLVPEINEDFVDGDPLYSTNLDMFSERNIYQFVDYDVYKDDYNKKNYAAQIFEKVIDNFLRYARKKKIGPVQRNISEKTAAEIFYKKKQVLLNEPSKIDFLWNQQKELYDELVVRLQHPASRIRKIFEQGLPCIDINYILERISYEKNYQGMNRYNNDSFLQKQINIMDKHKLKQRILKGSLPKEKQSGKKDINNILEVFQITPSISTNNNNILTNRKYFQGKKNTQQSDQEQQNKKMEKNQKGQKEKQRNSKYYEEHYQDYTEMVMQNKYGILTCPIEQVYYCVLCYKNSIDITLMPCGHSYCCSQCFQNQNDFICPSCNKQVSHVVNINLQLHDRYNHNDIDQPISTISDESQMYKDISGFNSPIPSPKIKKQQLQSQNLFETPEHTPINRNKQKNYNQYQNQNDNQKNQNNNTEHDKGYVLNMNEVNKNIQKDENLENEEEDITIQLGVDKSNWEKMFN